MSHLMQKKENIPAELGRFRDTGCGTMQAKKRRVPADRGRMQRTEGGNDMWLLVAAVLLLLFIWVFGEISDRMPRRRHKKRHALKRS